MSAAPLTVDLSTLSDYYDPLGLLQDQLQDLILIHHQQKQSALRDLSRLELPSLHLRALQYVYGEKSAAKCSMRFILTVSPTKEAGHPAEERLTLELSVRNTLCSVRS